MGETLTLDVDDTDSQSKTLKTTNNLKTIESSLFPCEKIPNYFFSLAIIFFLSFIDAAI